MNRSKALSVGVLLASAILGACSLPMADASGNPVGIGGLSARSSGAAFTSTPTLAFYRVNGATFVTALGVRDTCVETSYSDTTSSVSTASTIGGGPIVTIQLGGRTDTLARTAGSVDPIYRSSIPGGIPYTPGDSLVLTISGDPEGFPTASFHGKTAEAFEVNAFDVPASGDPINLSWTPAATEDAAMLMSFRFATAASPTLDRQVACTFVDDGTGTVPGDVAINWVGAANRTFAAQRIRTILEQVDVPRSYFNFVSSFVWPTPQSP